MLAVGTGMAACIATAIALAVVWILPLDHPREAVGVIRSWNGDAKLLMPTEPDLVAAPYDDVLANGGLPLPRGSPPPIPTLLSVPQTSQQRHDPER